MQLNFFEHILFFQILPLAFVGWDQTGVWPETITPNSEVSCSTQSIPQESGGLSGVPWER